MLRALIGIGALLAPSAVAAQQAAGDPMAGGILSRQNCAECHLVAPEQDIDPRIGPSFGRIASHASVTEMSLRAFLQTPHATMPNIMLTPEETEDVIAYILSLR